MDEGFSFFFLLLILFFIVLGILWTILPFAVFGIKSKLEIISGQLNGIRADLNRLLVPERALDEQEQGNQEEAYGVATESPQNWSYDSISTEELLRIREGVLGRKVNALEIELKQRNSLRNEYAELETSVLENILDDNEIPTRKRILIREELEWRRSNKD